MALSLLENHMATRTNKSTTRKAYRVNESLAGTDLFTYTCALFIFLGLFSAKSKGAKPGAITSFYNSGSIIRHHVGNSNMEKVDGRIKLTAKGRAHFAGRYADESAQYVEKSEAGQLAKFMKTGTRSLLPKEWADVTTSEITIAK